jgi:uncharacterized membrane protein YraQ (UPF0718 family)
LITSPVINEIVHTFWTRIEFGFNELMSIVLFQKGIPLGIALSFMMVVSALSIPEAIIAIGYLFNILEKYFI